MKLSFTLYVFMLVFSFIGVNAIRKKIIDEVHVCKRNDPEIIKCYADNYKRIIPMLKDGIPEMNILPIDPVFIEDISMDFTPSQSLRLMAKLKDVNITGLGAEQLRDCQGLMTSDGIQLYHESYIPELDMLGQFYAKGKILMLDVDASGEMRAKFSEMVMKAIWNTTRYLKNGKEYLKFTGSISDIRITKMWIYFDNLVPNNPQLNDHLNQLIVENLGLVYDDISPIIKQTVLGILLRIVNDVVDTFSYDELFPK